MLDEEGRLARYYVTPACRTCSLKVKCTRGEQRRITRWIHEEVLDRMRDRVRLRPNIMKLRREIVEHPFGNLRSWLVRRALWRMGSGVFLDAGVAERQSRDEFVGSRLQLNEGDQDCGSEKINPGSLKSESADLSPAPRGAVSLWAHSVFMSERVFTQSVDLLCRYEISE